MGAIGAKPRSRTKSAPPDSLSPGYTSTEEGDIPHYRHYISGLRLVLWLPVAVTVKKTRSATRRGVEIRPLRDEHGNLLYVLPGGQHVKVKASHQ